METIQHNRRIIIPAIILLALVGYGVYYVLQNYARSQELVVSGTIEATEIHLGTQTGGLVKGVYADEGDTVTENQLLAEVKPISRGYNDKIYAPASGVVLVRAAEPGEVAPVGSTLLVVGDLRALTLTVYVPEERVGLVQLGQTYPVSVDSFPGQTFPGRVTRIANQAEFTPRNVQTVAGRKNTVYAVRLSLDNPNLALKPGMPADVRLGQ